MWPFRKQRGEVLDYWMAPIEHFTYSPQTFYDQLKEAVAARKIPDLTIERVAFAQGGLLSDDRTYLRLQRDRLVFDVCAAPFGVGYFFSCRALLLPVEVKLWRIVVTVFVLWSILGLMVQLVGLEYGAIAFVAFLLALFATLRNAGTMNSMSLDAVLTKIPVFGRIYARWFIPETYYREDTRNMYVTVIPHLVREFVNSVAASEGVQLSREYAQAPVLGELYKPVTPREPERK